MAEKTKNNRVRYLLSMLKKENKIQNIGSDTKSIKNIRAQNFLRFLKKHILLKSLKAK